MAVPPSSPSAYVLSAVLSVHQQDVRAVLFPDENTIVSASRDQSVIVWERTGPNAFDVKRILQGHNHFVNSLAYVPPCEQHPNGLIVSGSSDKTIMTWPAKGSSSSPIQTLSGHTDNVCTLSIYAFDNTTIISGSWDKNVRTWELSDSGYRNKLTLSGHTAAVWAVASVATGEILTGSADKSIRIYSQSGSLITAIAPHADVIRSIIPVNPKTFVSASNDATLKVMSIPESRGEKPTQIAELHGHTSFIYAAQHIAKSSEVISCGEDRSVRVWGLSSNECTQTIMMPCTSVWCINACQLTGDIVTGGSDGVVRVFTRAPERIAAEDIITNFNHAVSTTSLPSQTNLGSLNKSNLPEMSAIESGQLKGNKEGQIQMVRVGSKVEAWQWSMATQTWTKVGEVVDAVGSGRKQMFEGKEYDYVFDVDIGDGNNLKLPVNSNDNPYSAAQDFIWKYELSQDFLEQIAQFIIKDTGGVAMDVVDPTARGDPFTGANRYIPGAGGSNVSAPTPKQLKYLPQKDVVTIATANVSGLMAKMKQFNNEAKENDKFSDKDLTSLERILNSQGSQEDVDTCAITLKRGLAWDVSKPFPIVDSWRLLSLRLSKTAQSPIATEILHSFLEHVHGSNSTNGMLALRGIGNLCNFDDGKLIWRDRSEVIRALEHVTSGGEAGKAKGGMVAALTLGLNLAILTAQEISRASGSEENFDFAMHLGVILIGYLATASNNGATVDEEAAFRAAVGLGTLLFASPKLVARAKDVGVYDALEGLKGITGKVGEVVAEVKSLLA